MGCYPSFLTGLPHNTSDLDVYGCVISYNDAVVEYNKLLNDTLENMRNMLPDANIIYVDTHSVKLDLFQHPKNHELIEMDVLQGLSTEQKHAAVMAAALIILTLG
ncbi:hypothetical protein Cni_G02294 [Canna indica]|uniref:Uncharacterized protein n=1 Tax=Canna indica TaxID=4628 RepID=A0AAQ3Q253_9LILI|nr:hypothetical protein Cni_G02294 [Canna indica]